MNNRLSHLVNNAFQRLSGRPDLFITFCQCVLLITGLAKILSYILFPELQSAKDKVLPAMTGRDLLLFAGLCELAVAAALMRLKLLHQLLLLYWLGLGILYYRASLYFLGGGSCSCLGKLSEVGGSLKPLINGSLVSFLFLMILGSVFYVLRLPGLQANRISSFGNANELLYDA